MTHPPPYTTYQAGHAPAPHIAPPPLLNPAYSGDVTYVSGQYETVHVNDGYSKLGGGGKELDDGEYLHPVSRDGQYQHPVSRDDKPQRESNLYMSIVN